MANQDGQGTNGTPDGSTQQPLPAQGKSAQGKALPPVAVARALLATAPGKRKVDLVLDSADPKAFVRRLPAEDLFFAVKEIGLADAVEIVGLASPSQFRAFVDLDGWERDQPDAGRILQWLRVAQLAARGPVEFRAKRDALDRELVVLLLKTQTVVHPVEEGEDPVFESDNWLRTAEGKYIVEITAEGDDGIMVRRLLEDFMAEDPFTATRLFEAVRWEMATELEETAYSWRTGRLRDMGFPEMEEAMRIWSPLPAGWTPRTAAADIGAVAGVPALLLVSSKHQLFLDSVAERLPDEARTPFNEGLVYLLNCAIVADGIDPKDLDLARLTLGATRDQLSLGLELASGGDAQLALEILSTTPATELFRHAVGELLKLSREAAQASKGIAFGQAGATVLDSPDAEILSGLRRKRPRLYEPPVAAEKKKGITDWRALRSVEDMQRARGAIARATAAGEVLQALGVDVQRFQQIADEAGRAVTATTVGPLVLTAALRTLHGGPATPDPLEPEAVQNACNHFADGKLTADARRTLEGLLASLRTKVDEQSQPAFDELASTWGARLESELGAACAQGSVDPANVESVLARAR